MNSKRRYIKKYIVGIMAAVMAAALIPAENAKAETMDTQAEDAVDLSNIELRSKNGVVPQYTAGSKTEWKLTVTNKNSNGDIEDIVVKPELGDTIENWPFQIEQQDYEQNISLLTANETQDISFAFTQREDVPAKPYMISFTIFVKGSPVKTQKLYINTTAKTNNSDIKSDDNTSQAPADLGGISNGDAVYSGGGGGGGSDSTSVPRVIVTGFTTNPPEVRAGQDFTLTVHLKNTSKTSRVQNMLFDLQAPTEGADEQTMAPAFLPSSGSSSIYLDGINADGAADIAINLNAKSDLLQKPYSIDLSMKYEDSAGAQVEAASSISIPVKQDARFELSEFELSPESIAVGEEANIMCNLYNMGRIKLYNVKASFEGACIEKEEIFLGNVDSGATASIDAMLEGKKATEGPAKVTMTLSYEDEAGKRSESRKELQIMVTDAAEDDMTGVMEEMEEPKSFPVIPAVIAAVIILAVIAAAIIVKRNKKKRMKNEEEALLDELDGPSEDEWQ